MCEVGGAGGHEQACAARTRSVHSKPDGKTDEQAGWAELCRCEPETKEEVAERRSTPKAAIGLCPTREAADCGDSKFEEALAPHMKQRPIEEAGPMEDRGCLWQSVQLTTARAIGENAASLPGRSRTTGKAGQIDIHLEL